MGLNWENFELPAIKLSKWKRASAVDQEIGQVFVAVDLAENAEHFVYICVSGDRQAVHFFNKRSYMSSERMRGEFSPTSEVCGFVSIVALHRLHGQS